MQKVFAGLASYLIPIIEFLLLSAGALLILRSRRRKPNQSGPTSFRSLERVFGRLARRRGLSVVVAGVSVIVLRSMLIPAIGIPQPRWNDEFSYLLAADTFAHGRITNPTHPMWIHFESFHIIQHPTYMSMYAPAQGLALAAGQKLGNPWIGQLLVTAALCSALCWMLQGWLPPTWAFFGAMLAVLRLGLLSYWVNGYWGGSVVALGGALLLGSLPRIYKHSRARDAVVMAVGIALLANSRPYEGLVVSVPFAVAVMIWVYRNRLSRRTWINVVLPLTALLLLFATATGYYYFRVTGSPFRLAYQVNRETYATAPYFLWQKPRPEPVYNHIVMRDFYRWELTQFEDNLTIRGALDRTRAKLKGMWSFYLGPALSLPLFALPWILRDRRMRFPLIALAVFLLGLTPQTWTFPHYFAPATGLLYLILVQGMRHMRLWNGRHSPQGPAAVRMIVVVCCAMILLRTFAAVTHTFIEPAWPRGNLDRAAMMKELKQRPGYHLVLVRYEPTYGHDVDHELVYNEANIDAAKVVLARDMGDSKNQELLRYFRGRTVWKLNGDESPLRLEPFLQ